MDASNRKRLEQIWHGSSECYGKGSALVKTLFRYQDRLTIHVGTLIIIVFSQTHLSIIDTERVHIFQDRNRALQCTATRFKFVTWGHSPASARASHVNRRRSLAPCRYFKVIADVTHPFQWVSALLL
jgi:hypothetical protein